MGLNGGFKLELMLTDKVQTEVFPHGLPHFGRERKGQETPEGVDPPTGKALRISIPPIPRIFQQTCKMPDLVLGIIELKTKKDSCSHVKLSDLWERVFGRENSEIKPPFKGGGRMFRPSVTSTW